MLILCNFLFFIVIWTIVGASSRRTLTSDEENGPLDPVKGFSLVNILSESSALLMWEKPESIHVPLTGFKVQTWVENDNEVNYKEIIVRPDVSKVLVTTLKPNLINFARIVPYNSVGNGLPSNTISMQMPEGVPGPVESLMSFLLGRTTVMLKWKRPLETNGKLQGYRIYYNHEPFDFPFDKLNDIIDADAEQAKISGLRPSTVHQFKVVGFTSQGNGDDSYIKQRTLSDIVSGAPTTPGLSIKCILTDSKYAKAKIIWHPDLSGMPGTHFYVKYYKQGETSFSITDPELLKDYILINELEPNEQFEFIVVAVGDEGETPSQPHRYFSSYQC